MSTIPPEKQLGIEIIVYLKCAKKSFGDAANWAEGPGPRMGALDERFLAAGAMAASLSFAMSYLLAAEAKVAELASLQGKAFNHIGLLRNPDLILRLGYLANWVTEGQAPCPFCERSPACEPLGQGHCDNTVPF